MADLMLAGLTLGVQSLHALEVAQVLVPAPSVLLPSSHVPLPFIDVKTDKTGLVIRCDEIIPTPEEQAQYLILGDS